MTLDLLGRTDVLLQVPDKHSKRELSTEDVKRYLPKRMRKGLTENNAQPDQCAEFHYEKVLLPEKFFPDSPRRKKPSDFRKFLESRK